MRALHATAAAAAIALLAGCSPQRARFPDDWIGSWRGELEMPPTAKTAGPVVMELAISRTDDPDRYGWTIVYDAPEGRQVRAYELLARNRMEGRYATDERNGIVLEAREFGGALYSWFSLGGSNVLVREELVRDAGAERIEVEFVTALDRDAVTTGPNAEVRSLVPVSVQRASLRRTAG